MWSFFRTIPLVMCLCLPGLVGCVTPTHPSIEGNALGDRKQVRLVRLQETRNWLPLKAEQWRYVVSEGDDAGDSFAVKMESEKDGWAFTYEDRQVTHLQTAADGSILIAAEEDLDEEVRVTYTPALTLLPAKLDPGKEFKGKAKVVVREIEDGSEKAKGSCKYHLKLVGQQKVRTPAGEFDAYLVRMERDLDLDLANVHVVTLTAYVPGQGQVAERVTQRTVALGLFPVDDLLETRLSK